MSNRINISKRKRFEILNRDNFTCQYCGRKAPNVELEVDHIKAVANGGTNDDENLITACHDCNIGKSARDLRTESLLDTADEYIEQYKLTKSSLEKFKIAKSLLSAYSDYQTDAMVSMYVACVGISGESKSEMEMELMFLRNDAKRMVSRYGRTKAFQKWYELVIENMDIEDDFDEFLEDYKEKERSR